MFAGKNVSRYMGRIHGLRIDRGGREMTKQRLRTQVQNINEKKLFADVEIEEIVGTGRAEYRIEALNKRSHEVMVI